MRLSTSGRIDEQALARGLSPQTRRQRGAYFTPVEVVDQVLDAVQRQLPSGRLAFIDPACGAGAFLARIAERFPQAELYGLELDEGSLHLAQRRVPRAVLHTGDALRGGALERLLREVRAPFEVWVGNPPYNGTSALLKDAAQWRALASKVELAKGQSLREDYVFFMLRALERLKDRRGALAFVTSATLLDAWAYAPVRKLLCEALCLREVQPLGRGVFRDTQVSTCFTVFTTDGEKVLREPFRPVDAAAQQLDDAWAARGARLPELVPFSRPGLKTRYDELLVDDERDVLIERMRRFCAGEGLALPHPEKLEALPRVPFDVKNVRRFIHPRGRRAWCYLDRRLIPRGDHRFQGDEDPHACEVKLAFSVRELPLWASVFDEPGCVTMYRHTRFAPLYWRGAVNLSLPVKDPRAAFDAIARFVMSDEVQQIWAPAFATRRDLPVPFDVLEEAGRAPGPRRLRRRRSRRAVR
jgi:tRNA1(Val) A37 N6-methylase TrmN6